MDRPEIMKTLKNMTDEDLERLDRRVARTRRRAAFIRTFNEYMNAGETAVLEEAIAWVQANPETAPVQEVTAPVETKVEPAQPAQPVKK